MGRRVLGSQSDAGPRRLNAVWLVVLITMTMGAGAGAQMRQRTPADSAQWRRDVATLDAILDAYYEVVSGPAGEAIDTARDHYLHHPQARVTLLSSGPNQPAAFEVVTLAEYHRRTGVGPRERAFYERETHRVEHVFGNMATVWSTYEYRESPDGPATGRGINTITLARDANRWWITGWSFESEMPTRKVPARYLPNDAANAANAHNFLRPLI